MHDQVARNTLSCPLQVIACACLFLGGKIEETPKALSDILKVMTGVRFAGQPKEMLHAVVPMLSFSPSSITKACNVHIRISVKSEKLLQVQVPACLHDLLA